MTDATLQDIRARLANYAAHKDDAYAYFDGEIDAVRDFYKGAPEDIRTLLDTVDRLKRHRAEWQEIADRRIGELAALEARIARLQDAIKPFAHFIEQFDRAPLNTADEFYAIHTGTEYAAGLRLSEFRAVAAALREGSPNG